MKYLDLTVLLEVWINFAIEIKNNGIIYLVPTDFLRVTGVYQILLDNNLIDSRGIPLHEDFKQKIRIP